MKKTVLVILAATSCLMLSSWTSVGMQASYKGAACGCPEISAPLNESCQASKDWDTFLDKYEKLVDTYISLYKKAKDGDYAAMAEYVKYMQQINELVADMGDMSTMSVSQMSRYMKITEKMTKAAAE